MQISDVRYGALPAVPVTPPREALPTSGSTSGARAEPADRVEISDAALRASPAEASKALSVGQTADTSATSECPECAAGICTTCGSKADQSTEELSEEERAQVEKLKDRDDEVRAHEAAHAATGGSYAGSPSFEYQTGPDGKRYAVGGEVSIDAAPIEGDPQASIQKLRTVQAAALAPVEPSDQDRKVAQQAAAALREAEAEASAERLEEFKEQTGETEAASETDKTPPTDSAEPAQSAQENQPVPPERDPAARLGGAEPSGRDADIREETKTEREREFEAEQTAREDARQTEQIIQEQVKLAAGVYRKIAALG